MKKGFTLIELLAVIVILAIIAVIAVPIVVNIIKEAKESANLRSAEFYLDAVELSIVQAKLNNKNLSNGTYNIKNGNICLNDACTDILEVEVNGKVPESGILIIKNKQIVEGTTIIIENTELVVNNSKVVKADLSNRLITRILGENNKNIVNSGNGLYVSTETNDGRPTYYYKGNVESNYVNFAEQTWKIIRINEDGTIRMLLNNAINNSTNYYFNKNNYDSYEYMYYSNSSGDLEEGIKNTVDTWYDNTLKTNYDSYIATTNFCEAAKVKYNDSAVAGNATMELKTNYIPNFKCPLDGNGKQYVKAKAGLITIDEAAISGIPMDTDLAQSKTSYLQFGGDYWTMSAAGYDPTLASSGYYLNSIYYVNGVQYAGAKVGYGTIKQQYSYSASLYIRPVISLNANVIVEESNGNGVHGSSKNPYVIKTN